MFSSFSLTTCKGLPAGTTNCIVNGFVQNVCETEGMILYTNEASQTVSTLTEKMAALRDEVFRVSNITFLDAVV